mgnify:CR=1 FL=1
MFKILNSFKKFFGPLMQEKTEEPCPHCHVPEETLKILKEKGEEGGNQELKI